MTEYKLFEGDVPHVSTAEYHADRERAPHLEQAPHQPRLHLAAQFVGEALNEGFYTVSDLGCGDGGLLSLIGRDDVIAWGYDFSPANAAGWVERGVKAHQRDVFGADRDRVVVGDVVVMTEVLEHLADPHGVLKWARGRAKRLVCSSPWNESPAGYSDCHAWAWDREGYASMIQEAGWEIVKHEAAGLFQVVMAK